MNTPFLLNMKFTKLTLTTLAAVISAGSMYAGSKLNGMFCFSFPMSTVRIS
jgi:hypothetical protein